MNLMLVQAAEAVVHASSEGGQMWLLALGPAGAAGVYWALYVYYRNTDKSHAYERETLIEAHPPLSSDDKFDTVRGTSRSSVSGDNHTKHRERVKRLG